MNQRRPQIIRVAVVLTVALIASILRYGFPPTDGWMAFLGAMIFFIGVQIPIWFTTDRFRDK
jgi:membrane protein YdbS with pleckstrin-like domain